LPNGNNVEPEGPDRDSCEIQGITVVKSGGNPFQTGEIISSKQRKKSIRAQDISHARVRRGAIDLLLIDGYIIIAPRVYISR
jgi:hypothetical protein